jgi:hypothetical protein
MLVFLLLGHVWCPSTILGTISPEPTAILRDLNGVPDSDSGRPRKQGYASETHQASPVFAL